jgi:hypothetical protein
MKFALIACLFLIACGGGDEPAEQKGTVAYCATQPGDFYCFTTVYVRPGQRVSVTVDGSVSGQTFARRLSVIVDDAAHSPRELTAAGQFQLRHSYASTAEGWVRVGFRTEVLSGQSAVADGAKISINAE